MQVIVLTMSAAFLIQLGYFIWKIAAVNLPRIGEEKLFTVIKAFLTSWKWLLGMSLRLLGLFLFVKATSIGALSLIQPLMSVGDVFIVLLAVIFLKERLVRLEWIGLLFILAGDLIISFEAKTMAPVLLNWFHVGIFICIAATALASLIVLARRKKQLEVVLALAVGVTFGVSMVLIKLMTSYLALNGKDVELLNCLLNPITPFIIANNILGLVILQIAFQNGRAAVIVPIQVSVISAIAVLAGIFLFSETVSIYRLLCISFIITGTALLQFASSVKRSLA